MSTDPHQPLAVLEPLVGTWTVEVVFPDAATLGPDVPATLHGRTTFAWVLDGAYLLQQGQVHHPIAPDVHSLIGPAPHGRGFLQHYYDARGVARLYDMTFVDGLWRLERYPPAPDFAQRFRAQLSADGSTLTGAWQAHRDGSFVHDFTVTYRREG